MGAPSLFPTIGIVGRHDTPGMLEPLSRLVDLLVPRGHRILVEAATAAGCALERFPAVAGEQLGEYADLVIAVGGDGTMLSIARLLAPHGKPLVGVNQGRLGFLTDIALADMETRLVPMLDGNYEEDPRLLLEAFVHSASEPPGHALALNDVVVARGASGTLIDLSVHVSGIYVCDIRGDGLIVATPTGSTAYALSADGPIIHPQVPAFALVPVCPHALTNRPIAIGEDCEVSIRVTRARDAHAHCDGHVHFALAEGDEIVVRKAAHRVRVLHPKDHDHFATLRRKLHWNETPERLGFLE
jgi:NAD+ kinase